MRKLKLAIAFMACALAMQAQLSSYSFYRELKPVEKAGFYEVRIGSSVLDRPGFYRVYELNAKDTIEIAHVKEDQVFYAYDNRYFKQVKIIDESFVKDKCSYATLVLDTDMVYNSVYLNLEGKDFFKDVTVEGSADNKAWKTIVEGEKLFNYDKGGDEHYFRNKISFKDVSFKYLRLKFEDSHSLKVLLQAAFIPIDKQYNVTTGEAVPCTVTRTEDTKRKQSIIECSLSRKYLVTILNFKVEHSSPHFSRHYSVQLLDDSYKKDNWISYGGGTLQSGEENSIILNNYSSDGTFKTAKIRLIIDNLDDMPLRKVDVEVFTHEEKIKLKLEPGKKY
ncbi:MAG: DUF3999 family protein, partial [Bacteroidia bacterium]